MAGELILFKELIPRIELHGEDALVQLEKFNKEIKAAITGGDTIILGSDDHPNEQPPYKHYYIRRESKA